MKILWFDHSFSCPTGSGGTRSYDLAQTLAKAGHDVTIVCATEFISNSGLAGSFRANRHDRREGSVDGIRIIEFDLAGGATSVRRIWARLRYAAALSKLGAWARADLIVATSASLSGVLPAALARIFRGKPFVFDARSLRSRVDRALGRSNPLMTWLMSALEKCAYRTASKIIATGDNIAEAIGEFGVEPFKVDVVPRVCGPALCETSERILPSESFATIKPGSLVAVFADRIEAEHGFDAVLDAAALLKLRQRSDIAFLLIGDGARRGAIAKAVSTRQLDNVTIAGRVPKPQLAQLLNGCDIGLQLLEADPDVHAGAAPAAFADYLAAGLPVLINYPGWMAGLVAQYDCGYTLRAGDTAVFADALEHAADHRENLGRMAQNAVELQQQEFDRQSGLAEFRKTVETVHQQAEVRTGQAAKRILDVCLAGTGLMVLGPFMALAAVLVRMYHGKPVFYRESCPGLFGRPVELLRFRVQRDAYRADGGALSDEERRTSLGELLEATSFASLPLLWNVLRGDISFVGPGALPMQGLSRLSGDAFRRQFVRPGLTGWAQTHDISSGAVSESEALAMDIWYVDNRSLALDLKILLMSIMPLLKFRNAPAENARPADKIDGDTHHNDQAVL